MKIKREQIIENFVSDVETILDSIVLVFDNLFKDNEVNRSNAKGIFRWLVYVSYSNIIGKLIIIYNKESIKINDDIKDFNLDKKYLSSMISTRNFYYNSKLNNYFYTKIESIVDKQSTILNFDFDKIFNESFKYKIKKINKINYYYFRLKRKIKNIIKKIILNRQKEIIIFEDSDFLNSNKLNIINIYNKKNTNDEVDYDIRNKIKKSIFNKLKLNYLEKEFNMNQNQISIFSKLVSEIIEHSLPISLIENLNDKLKFYKKYLNSHKIREIHSVVAHYFDDNFKVFCSIKKSEETKIIIHEHGITNFSKIYTYDQKFIFIKNYTSLKLGDYYYAWGRDKLSERWDGVEDKYKIKIRNKGSLHLGKIKKYQNNRKDNDLKMLYIGGPNKYYLNSFDEVMPFENYLHKSKISSFFKKIIYKYDNLKIVYKNFDTSKEGYQKDLIYNLLYKEIKDRKIKLSFSKPLNIYMDFDFIFLDMISTPVAEFINTNTPFIIFANQHEFKMASQDGKKFNKELVQKNILSYDIDNTLKNFQLMLENRYHSYDNNEIFSKFQKLFCYPITNNKI